MDWLATIDPQLVGLVHLSGVENENSGGMGYRDPDRVLLSEKDRLPTVRIIELLSQNGYQGPFSLEPFSPAVHALSREELIGQLIESKTIVEAAVTRGKERKV